MSWTITRLPYAAAGLITSSLLMLAGCGNEPMASTTPDPESQPQFSDGPQFTLKPVIKPVPKAENGVAGSTPTAPDASAAGDPQHPNAGQVPGNGQTPPAKEPAAPPEPRPKLLPWKDLEARFAELREVPDRTRLQSAYDSLTLPIYTESENYEQHLEKLQAWRTEFPQSPTPLIVMAGAYIDYAWKARGGGWAHTVTEEGWELFGERIERAHKLLEEALALGVKDGHAHSKLITIAMAKGLPEEQARAWLDEGLKLDPHYFQLYSAMTTRLLPRWQGKRGDVEKFAAEMREALPGDDGLEVYARIALDAQRYAFEEHLIFFGEFDHELLVQASQVLAERLPKSDQAAHFAALCAWVAQDHAAAQKIQPRVGPYDVNHRVWPWAHTHKEFLEWCHQPWPKEDLTFRSIWTSVYGAGGELAFTNDPQYFWMLTRGHTTQVALIDSYTGKTRAGVPAPQNAIISDVIASDRGWMATSLQSPEFTGVLLFNSNESRPAGFPTKGRCISMTFSPTEDHIACSEEKEVYFVDLNTGKRTGHSIPTSNFSHHLCYSADGKKLAFNLGHWQLWDVATGKKLLDFPPRGPERKVRVYCHQIIEIDAEGRALGVLGSATPKKISLVRFSADASTWDTVIDDMGRHPGSIALSKDRRLVALGYRPSDTRTADGAIEIWSLETGKRLWKFIDPSKYPYSLAFSPDGSTLAGAGSPQGLVRLWPVGSQEASQP